MIRNKKAYKKLLTFINRLNLKYSKRYSKNKSFISSRSNRTIRILQILKSGKLAIFKFVKHGYKFILTIVYIIYTRFQTFDGGLISSAQIIGLNSRNPVVIDQKIPLLFLTTKLKQKL